MVDKLWKVFVSLRDEIKLPFYITQEILWGEYVSIAAAPRFKRQSVKLAPTFARSSYKLFHSKSGRHSLSLKRTLAVAGAPKTEREGEIFPLAVPTAGFGNAV